MLYLNLETYAGMGGYFRDQDAPDLANVLYYAKQERDDIGIRIASMVKRMGDLDYIPPMKVWTDLRAVLSQVSVKTLSFQFCEPVNILQGFFHFRYPHTIQETSLPEVLLKSRSSVRQPADISEAPFPPLPDPHNAVSSE